MSIRNVDETPTTEAVLARTAEVAGARNDAALAAMLGTSRQVVAGWKKRGTIPHQKVCDFAQSQGASLDYLLLGRKPERLALDEILLAEIHAMLCEQGMVTVSPDTVGGKGLGQRLQTLRKRAGLSQTDLANMAAVGRPTISRLERGESNPPLDVVTKLVGPLLPYGLDLEWLLLGGDEMPTEVPSRLLRHITLVYNQVAHLRDADDRARSIAGAVALLNALTGEHATTSQSATH